MTDITDLLHRIDSGEPQASQQLLPLVYQELRRLAASRLAQEAPGQTLDATGLVHEAYLRLVGNTPGRGIERAWEGRAHFFGAAAEALRRILVENARRKARIRHGGDLHRVDLELDQMQMSSSGTDANLLAIHDALDELEQTDPQAAQIVKLHFFAGLPFTDVASVLRISERSTYREWSYARAWLRRRLAQNSP